MKHAHLLIALVLTLMVMAAAAQSPLPVVLMISIDGLRPDYVTPRRGPRKERLLERER